MNRRSFFAFLPIAPFALVAEGARAVGDDGDLWLKRRDGNWRKVVTE